MRVTFAEVTARRIARQYLGRHGESPVDAVRAMVGGHAQMMSAAELSIAARTEHVTLSEIREAVSNAHTLVKTYGPRGTVHLLPFEDLALWCAALDAAPSTTSQSKGVQLSADEREQVISAIGSALDEAAVDGRELDIDELDRAVLSKTGAWAAELTTPAFGGFSPRWRQAIAAAAHRGVLAFGRGAGRKMTYRNPNVVRMADSDTALRWLLLSYLRSYGPATPAQFARWLAVPGSWTRALFGANADALAPVEVEGDIAWVAGDDIEFDRAPVSVPRILLLPHFDPYVVGSYPRERLFPGQAADRALNRGQAGTFPVMLRNGIVDGVWNARRTSTRLIVTVEPLHRLSASQRSELGAEVRRTAHFLDLAPELSIGTVTVGAHA